MARELGCSPALVVKHRARGMPMTSADDARRWRAEHVRMQARTKAPSARAAAAPEGPAPVESFSVARAKREAALAHLAELDLAERRGELVRADHVEQVVALACSNAKDLLLGMPARVAPAVPGLRVDEVRALLDAEVTYTLEQLADGLFKAHKAPQWGKR